MFGIKENTTNGLGKGIESPGEYITREAKLL